jgi:hypothetical protein
VTQDRIDRCCFSHCQEAHSSLGVRLKILTHVSQERRRDLDPTVDCTQIHTGAGDTGIQVGRRAARRGKRAGEREEESFPASPQPVPVPEPVTRRQDTARTPRGSISFPRKRLHQDTPASCGTVASQSLPQTSSQCVHIQTTGSWEPWKRSVRNSYTNFQGRNARPRRIHKRRNIPFHKQRHRENELFHAANGDVHDSSVSTLPELVPCGDLSYGRILLER